MADGLDQDTKQALPQTVIAGQQASTAATASDYLSQKQRDLLFAALSSQAHPQIQARLLSGDGAVATQHGLAQAAAAQSAMDGHSATNMFVSPQSAELDQFNVDFTPDLDYLDGDASFDFEDADLGGDMIGGLPGRTDTSAIHEKRKSPSENSLAEEGDAKRQEVQEGEKTAKKPGRKPLTNEPTTKRKAQNRAAQRAFRERKEKHVKDLEIQVAELEKANEADKHENGLLKAKVERLQIELREAQKRLSLNSGVNRSSSLSGINGPYRSSSGSYSNSFQFDFPKFGALPGSQIFGNQDMPQTASPASTNFHVPTPPATTRSPSATHDLQARAQNDRQNSLARSMSPTTIHGTGSSVATPQGKDMGSTTIAPYSTSNNMHGFASTLPQMNDLGDLFSPSILKSANADGYFGTSRADAGTEATRSYATDTGGDSTAGLDRVFQFNSGSSASDSTSPSNSSSSQWNANGVSNSSCGTSPEPSYDSPAGKEKSLDADANASRHNSSHLLRAGSAEAVKPQAQALGTGFDFGNIDYSAPSMAGFDPVLFGDYRESNDAILGNGNFNGGFFDDALNTAPFDFGSPSNLFGILQSPQQSNATLGTSDSAANASAPSKALMAEVEKTRDGGDEDYGLPAQTKKADGDRKLISCNNIWSQLQSNPGFQEGKFDLDGLCSELRTKARCSESGVMIDQDHVDQALRKLGKKDEMGKVYEAPAQLMFEESSWDKVLQRMGGPSK